jgi:hypothetical protein
MNRCHYSKARGSGDARDAQRWKEALGK